MEGDLLAIGFLIIGPLYLAYFFYCWLREEHRYHREGE